ncbi:MULTISPECIES: cytochrome b [unclassified Moraxella]|uniref:cytochrome b n=1 Tax=unclassified Moraxella TaxID=2685852 RepID=UPI003AF9F503
MTLHAPLPTSQPLQSHGITKWSLMTRVFHWTSLILLFVTWVMIEMNDDAIDDTYLDYHKAFGLSVLLWTLARLVNRVLTLKKIPAPVPMPKWQTGISHFTHLMLYVILLAMPIAGWLTVMFSGEGVSFFGLFDIPAFVSENGDLENFFEKMHKNLLWALLLVFTALHVGGALYHQFIQKDNLIKRMR